MHRTTFNPIEQTDWKSIINIPVWFYINNEIRFIVQIGKKVFFLKKPIDWLADLLQLLDVSLPEHTWI